MKSNCSTKNAGFTLVELLVVIAIISILAGAAFMIINPAQLQRKSRESVLKAKVSQLCSALNACGAVKDDATKCDAYLDVGASDPTGDPVGAVYNYPAVTLATDPVHISGDLATGTEICSYGCSLNFSDGTVGNFGQTVGSICL